MDPIASNLAELALRAAEGYADGGHATRHLSDGASKTTALHPEADQAYSLAIKAVESTAHAIIEPNNKKGDARHHDRDAQRQPDVI